MLFEIYYKGEMCVCCPAFIKQYQRKHFICEKVLFSMISKDDVLSRQ